MARLVLTAVGAVVGSYFGYPQLGFVLGSLAGSLLIKDKVQGPKLDDLSAPRLAYGAPWPRLYGVERVSGAPLFGSDLRAVESTEDVGKGGGTEVTSTTYRMDLLLGLAIDTDAVGIRRIWANKKLVYNIGAPPVGASPSEFEQFVAAFIASQTTPLWSGFEFFSGDPAQLPWAPYEAAVGIGNAPAYRHRVTIGFQDLDVGSSGQPPLIEVEVFTVGSSPQDNYFDNFIDGKAPYSGDLIEFAEGSLEYGPYIQGLARGPGGLTKSMTRTITPVTITTIRFHFRNSSLGSDDSPELVLSDGATTRFAIIPMREFAIDITQSAYVNVSGTLYQISTGRLALFNWYQINFNIVAGFGNSTVDLIDAVTGTIVSSTAIGASLSPFTIDTITFVENGGVASGSTGSTEYSQLRLISGGAEIGTVDLADIVTAECLRVGLTAGQIDVTDLVGTEVTGFGTTSAARPTIEQLAGIFYFEAFCDDKIHFVKRGGASIETIAYADSGAGLDKAGEPFNGMERADELSVPAFYSVSLPDITRDYEPGSVMSDRLVTQSSEVRQVQAAVVMTPSQAKGRADSFARDARISSHTGEISLDIAHIARTPTDVITVTDKDGNTYRSRMVRMTFADMVMRSEIVLDDANALRETGVAPADGEPAVTVTAPGSTFLELIDGPILRDADDEAGLYGATRITGGTGTGSRVLKSVDGVTYASVGDVTTQSIGGQASTALADVANPYVWDEVSSVTVTSSGALSSSTRDAMQADGTINLAALKSGDDWEYLRYRTATLLSPGVYTLSGLMRGLRGTEAFIGTHAVGDRFIVLRAAGMIRIPGNTPEIGVERFYKGVTLGQAINSAAAIAFTNDAVGRKPFSPTRLKAERDTSGNITFAWSRRTRLAVRYGGSGGTLAPLGEDSEAYQIDVYDGPDVVRTLSATSESAAYSAANQTTDFGAPVAAGALDAEVFQISQTVGRGAGYRKSV